LACASDNSDGSYKYKPKLKAVVNAFKKLGARTSSDQVRLATGRKVRLLALDRPDYWKNEPAAAWAEEMKKQPKYN